MRRVSTRVFAASGAAAAKRFLTPSEDLKKLYESDFEKQQYPTAVVPSESSVFAQFLYKAGEQKNAFDAIAKDLETVQASAKKLPVFWERTVDVEQVQEFKGFNPATIFTMKWMQANGMLGELGAVKSTFDTFLNAKKNRIVATIYVPGPEKEYAKEISEAKDIAKKIHQENPKAKSANLEFKTVVDSDFTAGYAVEVLDKYYSTAKGRGEQTAAKKADVDYTNLPAHSPVKTVWEDSIETEVLRKYLDQLAKYDLEEQANGV